MQGNFFEFCKAQFKHTTYDPLQTEQKHFIQEFFFIEDIPRDESEVVALTTEQTCSYYSIHSTGQFCIIELRQVSCGCESCLEWNGKDCPNQAYASNWKAVNLHTGKAVFAETFRNLHWDFTDSSDIMDVESESNGESNISLKH